MKTTKVITVFAADANVRHIVVHIIMLTVNLKKNRKESTTLNYIRLYKATQQYILLQNTKHRIQSNMTEMHSAELHSE